MPRRQLDIKMSGSGEQSMTPGPRIGFSCYVQLIQIRIMCVIFCLIKISLFTIRSHILHQSKISKPLLPSLFVVPILRESGSISSRVGRTGLVAGRIATWLVYNRSCWFSDLLHPIPQLEESQDLLELELRLGELVLALREWPSVTLFVNICIPDIFFSSSMFLFSEVAIFLQSTNIH